MSTSEELSFEQQVKQTLAQVKTDESGKTIWPEDVPEAVLVAARAEKKYRDTQAAFTKDRQRLKALEAEKEKLVSQLEEMATVHLPEEEKTKLEELKFSDPDAWRNEINRLEEEAKAKLRAKLEEISGEAQKQSEVVARQAMLEQFLEENPGIVITDEVIENEIPPRITRKLEKGEVTFAEFLNECKDFLTRTKTIAKPDVPDEPNLGNLPGSSEPTKDALAQDDFQSYENEIF